MKDVLHFVFGIFGNATALFLFLSPIVTFRRIIKRKSTEVFSGIPYNMTMLNCLLSAWYGLPFISPDNLLVSTINGTGALIEAIYVLIFLIFAPKKARKLFCGIAAAIFSICMYASPLSIMRLVIKTKSVEYMPFLLSLFVFLCGTSWFIYGLLGHDPFVTVPNGCGSVLGAMQLILYAIYRKNNGKAATNCHSNGDSLKMNDVKPAQIYELNGEQV
ncbi:bidirectional sugar transporter SWEET1a-like isoform X2 [Asparagus officinalis]|uniref:bidirectional sugar transporter SWEET1a-like isoform X2 n=1 Tax=Asparagus officinalis TaxID=4686 RepID=UPI00098E43AF|nr:bidirectional sugar transporter SWEET1a-like isoform X2 [Asparagus officinalis]